MTKASKARHAAAADARAERAMAPLRRLACMLGEFHDVDPEEILRPLPRGPGQLARTSTIYYIRHELRYLARRLGVDQAAVARTIGVHHSTAQHSIRFIEYLKEDPDAFAALQWLEQRARENFERGDAFRASLEAARDTARRAKRRDRATN